MININEFITGFSGLLDSSQNAQPWEITNQLKALIEELLPKLGKGYHIENGVAIHETAKIEAGVTLKGPIIIQEHCFIGAHAYLREGVLLDESVKVGAGCEIKSSFICSNTAIAHLNYIGNSIIGSYVNFEAGSIAANHFNERQDKEIVVKHRGQLIKTHAIKFGALVGDHSKIGANAVLSPGTILEKHSIVKRLELVEQVGEGDSNRMGLP